MAKFQKGKPSPNPKGRPPGRNELSEAAQRKITPAVADKLIAKFVDSALKGSIKSFAAVSKLLPAPPPLQRPVEITLPPINSAADAGKALAAVIDAMSKGSIPLEQADQISAIIARCGESLSKSADIVELFEQIAKLKEIAGQRTTPP